MSVWPTGVRLVRGLGLVLIALGLSATGLFLASRGSNQPLMPTTLPAIHWPSAALVAACLVAWWLLAGWRIRLLAQAEGATVAVSVGTRAFFVSLFAAAVTPAGAGSTFGFAWFLSRFTQWRVAAAVAIYGLTLDMAFFAWVVPVSLAILAWRKVDLGLPGLVPAALAAAAGAFILGRLVVSQTPRLKKFSFFFFRCIGARATARSSVAFVRSLHASLTRLQRAHWSRRAQLHAVTALGFAAHFLAFNAVGASLSVPFDHLALFAAQALVSSVGMLVPTPGGSGFYELALHRVFTASGGSGALLLPLVAIWRVLSFYLYLLLGPLVLLGSTQAHTSGGVRK